MSKIKPLSLNQKDATAIATAVFVYAEAAYPAGGSECAQATNQTLKELAKAIGNSHEIPFSYKKRQKPMIKAAVKWFYSADNPLEHDTSIEPEQLLLML